MTEPRMKTGKRVEKASTHKRVATELHSIIVRSYGRCEYAELTGTQPECVGPLNCCHIIRRARSAVRTDLANGMCCCQKHHGYLDSHLADLIDFVDQTRGAGTYRRLQAKADAYDERGKGALTFWRDERARLKAIVASLGLVIR